MTSNMDLFLHTSKPSFEPTAVTKAASAQLDEDPENWPREILTELFRAAPETSDYTPKVEMLKVDDEQGFGLGVIVVENTTDSALAAARTAPQVRRILVPIVIKNHMLMPLDLIMMRNGKMLPLTPHGLRSSLFRPETFEMTTEDWGDTSLYNQFYPPGRSDNDFGAGISQGIGGGTQGAVTFIQGPGMKLSSAGRFSMLQSVLPTILQPDITKLASEAQGIDLTNNDVLLRALQLLASVEKTARDRASDLLDVALSTAPVHAAQVSYDDAKEMYVVKRASRTAYRGPVSEYMTRSQVLKFAGAEVVAKVDTDGATTISPDPVVTTEVDLDASKWHAVHKPGIYKVKTVHGKEMTGWVIPDLIDLDGTNVPMCVFTNGAAAMVQGAVIGAHVASAVDLPAGPAKGTGCFYAAGQGGVQATVPVLVQGATEEQAGGKSFLVTSITGEESKVRLVPGLNKIVVSKGEIMMPSTAKFLPLSDENMVALVDSTDMITKTAADATVRAIRLYAADDEGVSLEFVNLPKLASVTAKRLSTDDAAFVLALAGASPKLAHNKIAQAQLDTVMVPGLLDVSLASDLIESTRKIASSRSHEVTALRQNLVKEAASLPDTMTVDAVLSLGFINSENVRMFVSNTPYLEKCLSKICELVLASRLGLSEIPEFAAARAARALDETVQGLKALALRDASEGASAGS